MKVGGGLNRGVRRINTCMFTTCLHSAVTDWETLTRRPTPDTWTALERKYRGGYLLIRMSKY